MSLKEETGKILKNIENPDGGGYLVIFRDVEWENPETGKLETRCIIEKHLDKLTKPSGWAREEHFQQYPKQYALYKEKKRLEEGGKALKWLPEITPSEVERCQLNKIYTIESLAEASDDAMIEVGKEELRDRAKAFLSGETEKDLEIAELKAKLKELENDSPVNGSRGSGRNPTVRASDKRNKQQQ